MTILKEINKRAIHFKSKEGYNPKVLLLGPMYIECLRDELNETRVYGKTFKTLHNVILSIATGAIRVIETKHDMVAIY